MITAGFVKFIPDCYKRGSIDQRLGILAGLMDTDGSLTTGGYDFLSARQSGLRRMWFSWGCGSIGLRWVYMKPCRKGCQGGFVGDYYRVSISGEVCFIPCRIHRKKAPRRQQKKQVWKTGFKVELLPEDDYYGFTITGDGRYLMGDFTVTHNTGKTLMAISLLAMKAPERALIIAPQGTMRSSDGGEDDDEQEYAASAVDSGNQPVRLLSCKCGRYSPTAITSASARSIRVYCPLVFTSPIPRQCS